VTDAATVAAKFASCATAFVLMLAATLPGVIAVALVSTPAWKVILCGYMGLFLLGCSYLSFGPFASTLTPPCNGSISGATCVALRSEP